MGHEGATEGSLECKGVGLSFLACNYISPCAWCYLLLPREYKKITSNMVKQKNQNKLQLLSL